MLMEGEAATGDPGNTFAPVFGGGNFAPTGETAFAADADDSSGAGLGCGATGPTASVAEGLPSLEGVSLAPRSVDTGGLGCGSGMVPVLDGGVATGAGE